MKTPEFNCLLLSFSNKSKIEKVMMMMTMLCSQSSQSADCQTNTIQERILMTCPTRNKISLHKR